MAMIPFAVDERIPKWNNRPRRSEPECIVFHVAVAPRSLVSLRASFASRSDACSNAYVNNKGGVRQYMDSMQKSAGVRDGAERVFDVETAGGQGADANEPWSAAQCESLAMIAAWGHLTHGIPLRRMTSSKPGERGIGFHRLGVPRSKYVAASAPDWLVPGGETWSGAVGKVCPGPARIQQVDAIIARAKQIVKETPELVTGGKPSKPAATKPPVVTKPSGKSITQLADEVIAGKHGSGDARKRSLGAKYTAVQAEVNRRLTGQPSKPAGKSISQMASEVITGRHGTGHAARQKSLNIDSATYAKVRAEVNRRFA